MGMEAVIKVRAIQHDFDERTQVAIADRCGECIIFTFEDAHQKNETDEFKLSFRASYGYGVCKGVIVSVFSDGNITRESFAAKKIEDEMVHGKKQFRNHPDLVGFCVYIENDFDLRLQYLDRFLNDLKESVQNCVFGAVLEQVNKNLEEIKCELLESLKEARQRGSKMLFQEMLSQEMV